MSDLIKVTQLRVRSSASFLFPSQGTVFQDGMSGLARPQSQDSPLKAGGQCVPTEN